MPLQPVPPQYTPRTFQNIEDRLRRLERGGFGVWRPFDAIETSGFSLGSGGSSVTEYRTEGQTVEISGLVTFGSGATPVSTNPIYFLIPEIIRPDHTAHVGLWISNNNGIYPGSLQINTTPYGVFYYLSQTGISTPTDAVELQDIGNLGDWGAGNQIELHGRYRL